MENGLDGLEAIGSGFNITLETPQCLARRAAIAAKIREYADHVDEAV